MGNQRITIGNVVSGAFILALKRIAGMLDDVTVEDLYQLPPSFALQVIETVPRSTGSTLYTIPSLCTMLTHFITADAKRPAGRVLRMLLALARTDDECISVQPAIDRFITFCIKPDDDQYSFDAVRMATRALEPCGTEPERCDTAPVPERNQLQSSGSGRRAVDPELPSNYTKATDTSKDRAQGGDTADETSATFSIHTTPPMLRALRRTAAQALRCMILARKDHATRDKALRRLRRMERAWAGTGSIVGMQLLPRAERLCPTRAPSNQAQLYVDLGPGTADHGAGTAGTADPMSATTATVPAGGSGKGKGKAPWSFVVTWVDTVAQLHQARDDLIMLIGVSKKQN